jgi:hypothetical protein
LKHLLTTGNDREHAAAHGSFGSWYKLGPDRHVSLVVVLSQ